MIWPRKSPVLQNALPSDAEAMATIHKASFLRGWSASEFDSLLGQEGVVSVVARNVGQPQSVIGFALARSAADESEILSIAVRKDMRRTGLGGRLLDELLRQIYAERIGSVFLEVEETNEAALALYRRRSFEIVGHRDGYYRTGSGQRAAALVMRCNLR